MIAIFWTRTLCEAEHDPGIIDKVEFRWKEKETMTAEKLESHGEQRPQGDQE